MHSKETVINYVPQDADLQKANELDLSKTLQPEEAALALRAVGIQRPGVAEAPSKVTVQGTPSPKAVEPLEEYSPEPWERPVSAAELAKLRAELP